MGDGQNHVVECEMLKALYDFDATLAKALSFNEGEFFFLQQQDAKQRNWWHVVNRKGQVGFVPSNYVAAVKVQPDFFLTFLNDCIKNIHDDNVVSAQKNELIARLSEKKKEIQIIAKPVKCKKQAPKPPPRLDDCTPPTGVSPSFDTQPVAHNISEERELDSIPNEIENNKENDLDSSPVKPSICKQQSSDTDNQEDSIDSCMTIHPNVVYQIVQAVRKETQLSHNLSKVAVETVLISLTEILPRSDARTIIEALIQEVNSDISCPKNAINAAPDARRMLTALNGLAKATNDAQQRGWALYDDEHEIQTHLLELISVMTNADLSISQYVLSINHYSFVTTLVQYYQMETRWQLRQLLMQAFGIMCGLDRTAVTTLALSALPAELARYMEANPQAVSKLSHSALLLSMILSMGDKLPITHYEQLGVSFAQFLLDLIEEPPEVDEHEQIPDLFITLLLSYNLQFDTPQENLLLNALATRNNAVSFSEKILLLFNREEDPVRIFDHEPAPPHSILKLMIDLFSRKKTAHLFYTNDVKVAFDIIVRQLADLSPGDTRRQQYLEILPGIIRHTDYTEIIHRRDDLCRSFRRICCEEGDVSKDDQMLIRAIAKEFHDYFKTSF